MTARAKRKPAATAERPALTRADCKVTAARGHQKPNGWVAFSGLLWVRDLPVGSFHNDGDGGCDKWDIRPQYSHLFTEFEALAKAEFPDIKFEQADWFAGILWDEAVRRAGV